MEPNNIGQQSNAMERQENEGNPGFKRPPKPEEQALVDEFAILSAQYGDQFPHICQYLQKEANRIARGHKSLEEEHFLDIESGKPVRLTYKVSVPIEKYPNFNYVGRLLGPKGSTLKGMQEISGCKLAILGRGSMRDKAKEEQCRQEGGKYTHLNDDLHVWIQAFGPPDMAFYKLYVAAKEIKKYLHADYNDDIFTEQMMVLEQDGTLPQGYTAARSAPRGRGGRGMMRGGMSNRGGMMSGGGGMGRGGASRGGGMMRGGMRGRVSPVRGNSGRGGRGMYRGGANSNSVPAETLYEDVYEPAPQNFNLGYENGSSAVGGGASASSYFDEFPEPRTGGSGDGLGYQRQSQGYGGNGMGGGGMRGGMGGGMGSMNEYGGMGMMGMKRGMDDMDQPSKFPRRY